MRTALTVLLLTALVSAGCTDYDTGGRSAAPEAAGVAVIIVVAITGLVLCKARKWPYLAVGWLWFMGTLVPVLGLIQAGLWPALADRYAYVPQIGIFIMLAGGIAELMGRWRISEALLRMTAVIAVIVLAVAAWTRSAIGKIA